MHLWNADASLRWECEGLRLPKHGRILKRPSLGSCVPLFALKRGLAAATHHARLADGVPAGCGRVFAFSSALLFSKAGSGKDGGGMRLALIVLTDSPQGSPHQLLSASSLHINTSFRSSFFLWILTKKQQLCVFVWRQEGLRPEEPKTGLSSAAFLAACEGEATQVWKRLLLWLLSGTGNLSRVETFMSLYFWTDRGESWLVLWSFEGPESGEHENILGGGCKLCRWVVSPLDPSHSNHCYWCQDGSKRTEQQRDKRIYIR